MVIIAFGYKKMRGKDSSCNFLKDWLSLEKPDLKVKKLGFADKLKDISFQLYGWSGLKPGDYYESHYNQKEVVLPLIGMSPREIWIGVGNKLREVYEDTWIKYALYGNVDADVVLIKDLGYPNEGEAVIKAGGFCYRVDRPDQPDIATDGREVSLDGWDGFCGIIKNVGTLRDLYADVINKVGVKHFS